MESKLSIISTFTESVSSSIYGLIRKRIKHRDADKDDAILHDGERSPSKQKVNENGTKTGENTSVDLDTRLKLCTSESDQNNRYTSRQSHIDLTQIQEITDPNSSFIVDPHGREKEELTIGGSRKSSWLVESDSSSGTDRKDDIDKETYDLCLAYLLRRHSERYSEENDSRETFSVLSRSEIDSDSFDSNKFSEFISKHCRRLCYPQLNETLFDCPVRDWNDDNIESQTTLMNACSLEFSNRCSNSLHIGMIEVLSDYVMECYRAFFNGPDKQVDAIFSEPIMLTYEQKDVDERGHGYSDNMFSLSAISAQTQFLTSSGSLHEKRIKNLFINGSYNTVCSSTTHYSESNFVVGDKESSCQFVGTGSGSAASVSATEKIGKEIEFFDDVYYSKTLNKETDRQCDLDSKEDWCYNEDTGSPLKHTTSTTRKRSNKSIDKSPLLDGYPAEENSGVKVPEVALPENQDGFGDVSVSRHVFCDAEMKKLFKKDTDIQVVSPKTLEVLYPVKPSETPCPSYHELGGTDNYNGLEVTDKFDSSVRYHPCMTGDYIDQSELIEEEEDGEMEVRAEAEDADEECLTDYGDDRGGETDCESIISEAWSFINKVDSEDTNGRYDTFNSVFNNSEFKDGVLNVLEDFLKDNYLISNMKSDDYDVYIIPKSDVKTKTSSLEDTKSSGLHAVNSRLYKCYSLGCNQYGSESRQRASRRSPRTLSSMKYRKDTDDVYDFTDMSSENCQELYQKECIDASKFSSWPFFHPKRMKSASCRIAARSESEDKSASRISPSKAHFGNTDSSAKSSAWRAVANVDGQRASNKNKTVELIKAPKKRKQKSVLEELNTFKRVLSEVERKQNALLQLLSCDPCGLSYNFPGELNRNET